MTIKGVDYAFAPHPSVTALKNAGITFVCRYLSDDDSKNLTATEMGELLDAGFAVVLNWESSGQMPSEAQGVADAKTAEAQATALGWEFGPVYFSADFNDASDTQVSDAVAYMAGVASIIGADRAGVYGCPRVLEAVHAAGHAAYYWEVQNWGTVGYADLSQYEYNQVLDGASVDYDEASSPDFGQCLRGTRHTADGSQSLDAVASSRSTTAAHLAAVTRCNLNDENRAKFNTYYAHPGDDMPEGLVYYTSN